MSTDDDALVGAGYPDPEPLERLTAGMEFVPCALACGHLLQGVGHFDVDPERHPSTLVECPEGCGWVSFTLEPKGLDQ